MATSPDKVVRELGFYVKPCQVLAKHHTNMLACQMGAPHLVAHATSAHPLPKTCVKKHKGGMDSTMMS